MNKRLSKLAFATIIGASLVSCSNDLKTPGHGGDVNSLRAIVTPDVIAWSGNETLGNTFTGAKSYGTRAQNTNANQWADPDYGSWSVPDPLTEGQKERVRAYFQANPNLDYVDPHWNNFFVQQVYKGYDNPGSNSPEIYTSANGTTTSTSDNMNLMTVGQNNVHINNFNSGTCSTNDNVLDNGGNTNDGPFHSDQITLMEDINDTSCFGYHETNGSKHHNDKAALVSAEIIDAWAAANGNPGEPVVDKWGRSFLGFDLELRIAQDVVTNTSMKYANAPGQPDFIKNGDSYEKINDKNAEILYNGQPVYFVDADMNQFLGEKKTLSDNDYIGEYRDATNNNQYMGKYMDMSYIYNLLDEGWLPVANKDLREWVKVVGGDGYYSDWIVCLTEAKKISQTPTPPVDPSQPTDPTDPTDPNEPTEPGDNNCEWCEHPAHEPGECPDSDCDNPRCNPVPDHAIECPLCGHPVILMADGVYVHYQYYTEVGEVCGTCNEEENPSPCSTEALNEEMQRREGEGNGSQPGSGTENGDNNGNDNNNSGNNNNGNNKYNNNEVEINLSINDVHKLPNGNPKYDIADLVSKLSIHVRYPKDVEVILPVPQNIYCDQDDLYIFNAHYENDYSYGGDEEVIYYTVGDQPVELHIEFVAKADDQLTKEKEGYIRVWTKGINKEVIAYCRENYGDGINFEIYTYYNRGNQYTTGSYKEITEQELQELLNNSMITFDPESGESATLPDFYINAYNEINKDSSGNGVIEDGDCSVYIVGDSEIKDVYSTTLDQRKGFWDYYIGTHLNGSHFNWIYTNKSVPGSVNPNQN